MFSTSQRAACRTALVNLDESNASILRDCFRQFRISTVDVASQDGKIFDREKYDAAVLRSASWIAHHVN